MNLESNIEKLEEKIKKNASKIDNNADQIQRNTGALEILHTINDSSKRFYNMWFITFVVFLCSVGLNIFLLIKLLNG